MNVYDVERGHSGRTIEATVRMFSYPGGYNFRELQPLLRTVPLLFQLLCRLS